MRLKQVIYFFILTLLLSSGIGRDDVPLSKYYEFANNPVFDCVGEMYYNNEFSGTCVLIDKKFIITAGHNFFFDSKEFIRDSIFLKELNVWRHRTYARYSYKGKIELFTIRFSGIDYKLKNIHLNETYTNGRHDTDYLGDTSVHRNPDDDHFDLAIAELETKVKNVNPASFYKNDDELGKQAAFAGFGEVEVANEYKTDNSLHQRRKLAGENMIDSVGGFKIGNNWGALFFDFDDPSSDCCNRMGSPIPLSLEYFPNGGDCGGGLFINEKGTWKLAGICTSPDYPIEHQLYGDKYGKYYGFTCYYQRLFAFKDWIKEKMKN
ncbi:MAG: hypothetical protein ACHQK8_07990 [Bacteroidia bacterium]